MALKINKPGKDLNGESYPYLHVNLQPIVEEHYDRVSVNTTCFNGLDISINGYGPKIVPEGWDRFDPIKIPLEDGYDTDLNQWVHQKCSEELSTVRKLPYEYMKYEEDVYDLDPSTGDPILDPSTGQPIVLHKAGDFILKANGTYRFYEKELTRFCEAEDIEII